MKFLLVCFPFLFILSIQAHAQDSTIVLGSNQFDHNQAIDLGRKDGWIFQPGNDSAWQSPSFAPGTESKFYPSHIMKSWADKNGRIEGWFRVKFRLDRSLENLPLQLYVIGYSANEIYIDGEKVISQGNTSLNNFKRPVPDWEKSAIPFNFEIEKEYFLSIHFVNKVPSIPLNIVTPDPFFRLDVLMTGPEFLHHHYSYIKDLEFFDTLWLSVSLTLSFLFWLLSFQIPLEKNLPLIATSTSSFALSRLSAYLMTYKDLPFNANIALWIAFSLFTVLMISFIPIILSNIFSKRVTRNLAAFVSGWTLIGFLNMATINHYLVNIVLVIIIIVTSLYFVFSSWKNLKGAQWAIVFGVLFTLFWVILYILKIWLFPLTIPEAIDYVEIVILTGLYLSFPLSLLIFVSLRFREIIQETRENARQVVEMTEEKRQLALNQQIVLEEKVKERTNELNQSLEQLKSTQTQLVHAEKMAALGELTAGIAHEIQNPLNFVNNFSDINAELSREMNEALQKNDISEAKQLASDIESNQNKIREHGLRADGIVKSMLQHSRKSSGHKEPTDINNLCNEYLRLSYHGMRARDKSFNADFATDFDDSIGKISIIPQDISRVLLNIFNNAFYTVNEKAKKEGETYKPFVTVHTRNLGEKVEISIKDNGEGIPDSIKDKILQPFFTTKPTGQGTGLGLSISYDIVKAHDGNIHFESHIADETDKGSGGTIFKIELPG